MARKKKSVEIIPVVSEYDKLVEEILELELKLAALAEEIDDLENHVCVELRAEYDQKVGNLEYQAQAYRLEIARLKRAIELLQAAINRQEAAKYEDVQKRIEEEYKEYEEELHKKAEDMNRDSEYAKRRAKKDQENEKKAEEERKTKGTSSKKKDKKTDKDNSEDDKAKKEDKEADSEEKCNDSSTDGDSAESEGFGAERVNETPKQELKRLYRYIVKKLHPDANPDATEKELEMLRKAQKAYSEGDLETLREIADQLDDTELTEKYSDTPEDLIKLRELRAKLAEKVEILMEHIEEIKNSFPYNEKAFLADDEAVAKRQDEITEFNRACADKIIELQKKILELSEIAEKNQKEAEKRKRKKS